MAVGKSSKAATLGVTVRNEVLKEIAARGSALNMKKGTYAALLFEWWAQQGFPAVTPADQAMQDLKALQAAESTGKYRSGKKTA